MLSSVCQYLITNVNILTQTTENESLFYVPGLALVSDPLVCIVAKSRDDLQKIYDQLARKAFVHTLQKTAFILQESFLPVKVQSRKWIYVHHMTYHIFAGGYCFFLIWIP